MIIPNPTRRAGIDSGWNCNINCKFCYHSFNSRTDNVPLEDIKSSILAAKDRGNNYIDLVGPGEPSLVPYIAEVIKFIKNNDMKVCMITNAVIATKRLNEIINAGIDDFLISMHGMESVHNYLTGCKVARKTQESVLKQIINVDKTFRINYVINNYNYSDIVDFSNYIIQFNPRIVNFINFNPHGDWAGNKETNKFTTELRNVEPNLNIAIDNLENNNIGVNVRYYPMCRIKKEFRKNICNDLQVMFDPYEWDYNIIPKTMEKYREYGKHISNTIENKLGLCSQCQLKNICGGINVQYNIATNNTQIDTVIDSDIKDNNDFYYYRQHNSKVFELV